MLVSDMQSSAEMAPRTDASIAKSAKLSVNVSGTIGNRLRQVAFQERLSESSIVQIALQLMFDATTNEDVGEFLRENGASLRR
jgi:hypothetical protein